MKKNKVLLHKPVQALALVTGAILIVATTPSIADCRDEFDFSAAAGRLTTVGRVIRTAIHAEDANLGITPVDVVRRRVYGQSAVEPRRPGSDLVVPQGIRLVRVCCSGTELIRVNVIGPTRAESLGNESVDHCVIRRVKCQ